MFKSEQEISDETLFITDSYINLDQLGNIDWNPGDDYSLLPNQEDTMDASVKFSQLSNEFIPYTPVGPPDRSNFAGSLTFEVEICGNQTSSSKYLYSHRFNRIYVDMGYSFPIQFKWDPSQCVYPTMYVRATTVFSDQSQSEKRVTRCIQHYHETLNNGAELPKAMRLNVLHSARGLGTQDVYYCGGEDSPDKWLSVLVRFSAPSTHSYQFVCKNSCSSGINRRAIAIIFTLEDFTGKVWGRQTVGARVCSCPKRDITREETEVPRGKRLAKTAAPAAAPPVLNPKKIRLQVTDTDELIQLPQVTVVGRRAFNTGLTVMLNMMEEKRAMYLRSNLPTEDLDTSIASLKSHLETGDT